MSVDGLRVEPLARLPGPRAARTAAPAPRQGIGATRSDKTGAGKERATFLKMKYEMDESFC
jgi:hypothetical protein